MNKRLYALHGWLGLNFGLVLLIVCLSGTIAVVSHEIDWLLTPAMRVTPQSTRVSFGTMYQAVRRAHPDVPIRSLWVLPGSRFACQFWIEPQPGETVRVFVDPHTGEVRGETAWFNTQRFFRDFHRRFFVYSWWGVWLVAAYGFALLLSAVTGLAFYKRWWAKLLTLRVAKGPRVFWSDLHRLAGIWTLLFAIVISLTGIWYLVEIPLSWAGLPTAPRPSKAAPSTERLIEWADPPPVDEWVRTARQAIPELDVRSIRFPRRAGEPAYVDGQAQSWLVRDRANKVLVDSQSGKLLFAQRGEDLAPLARWADTADPLHFGDFGGLTSKLVWVAFGLVLSATIPTGAYLWVRRADQIAAGADKRIRNSRSDDSDVRNEIRRAVRRRVETGIASTAVVLLLAGRATCVALREQLPATSGADTLGALGGTGAITIYGGFGALTLIATAAWSLSVWFRRRRIT